MSNDNPDIARAQVDHDEDENGEERQAAPVGDDEDREHVEAQEEPGDECEDTEVIDPEAEEEFEKQRVAIAPEMPSKEMVAEHRRTHIPFRPWCWACVWGKGKKRPSLRLAGDYAEGIVARIRMDYAKLTENDDDDAEDKADEGNVEAEVEGSDEHSQTMLVMQESQCGSVWSYGVEHKGGSESWVVHQICEDLETVGMKNERVIVKTDKENSAAEVAREVARERSTEFGTAVDHSAVGESNSNGTIERAIQDVEGQCRTLRKALEDRVTSKFPLKHPVTPWLIRHAGYLITRCRVRPSGRTSFQLMKGRRANGKLFEFGENVHFKIPKTPDMPGKYDDQWSEGIWLGSDMRSGKHLVGKESGVFRVYTVRPMPEDKQWSKDRLDSIRGTPKQPVPGQAYNRSPAYSRKHGMPPRNDDVFVKQPDPERMDLRNWRITKQNVLDHG